MPYMHTIHVGTLYVYASHVGRSLEVVIANNNNNNLIVFQNNYQSHHFSELIIVQHIRMKFLSIKKRKKIHIAHLLTCMPYTCAIYVCRMLYVCLMCQTQGRMATMPVQLAHLPHLIFHLQVPVSVRSCVGGRG